MANKASLTTITQFNLKAQWLAAAIEDFANAWEDYEGETGEQPVSVDDYFLNESLQDFAARVRELWTVK